MIKAVFFDVDGTLVDNHERISESSKKALCLLKEKNIKLFIATGRPKIHLPELIDELPVEIDGWVIMNGSYCYVKDQVIREDYLHVSELEAALAYLKEKDIGAFIVEEEETFINFVHAGMQQNYIDFTNTKPFPLYDESRLKNHHIYQMMVHINEEDHQTEKHFFDLMKNTKGARWNQFSTDVIPKEGGKIVGIESVLHHFGISMSETLAIGDGENDAEMIEKVGIGVAMGNACKSAKDKADYVTDDIEHDGLYKAMKHFELI